MIPSVGYSICSKLCGLPLILYYSVVKKVHRHVCSQKSAENHFRASWGTPLWVTLNMKYQARHFQNQMLRWIFGLMDDVEKSPSVWSCEGYSMYVITVKTYPDRVKPIPTRDNLGQSDSLFFLLVSSVISLKYILIGSSRFYIFTKKY